MLFTALFFALVQIDGNHNLMLSFPESFKLGFLEFLVALNLVLVYPGKQKKKYLWVSALVNV